jgi:hypothetical protein
LLGAGLGCSKGLPPIVAPPVDASGAGAAAVSQYDANGNGKIDGEELDKTGSLKGSLQKMDGNGDGALSADEITAQIREWQDSKVGRMSVDCCVLQAGQPLEGANVTFVPEKFLGEATPAAKGVTGKFGIAIMSIETSGDMDPPGVAPGFYRVEITKPGAEIPAKYNTETIFGVEVSEEAMMLRGEVVFPMD